MSPAKARKAAPRTVKKAAKRAAAPKKGAKAAAKKPATKFVRTGTAGKGEGDGAVKAWIARIKPEHQETANRFDALAGATLPGVVRAVKWNAPFYGLKGKGRVATMGSFKHYVSFGFFAGTDLSPQPPEGESGRMRRVLVHDAGEFDEGQLRAWLRQAGAMPGWGKV
jgi:hypothetical protein